MTFFTLTLTVLLSGVLQSYDSGGGLSGKYIATAPMSRADSGGGPSGKFMKRNTMP